MKLPHFIRRWMLRNQLYQIEHQLMQIAIQREQDRHDERLLLGRRAVIKSQLSQI